MPRYIHIVAISEIYSVFELVEESKCVERLKQIRDGFMIIKERPNRCDAKLVVKTCVHNPELPFKN